jgi:hypothetical protein
MTAETVSLASLSAAMDGGFVGVADVADVMQRVGAMSEYRLIGGITVMLHVQRLDLDLPLRATGDADFGITPHLLRDPSLVKEIEKLGYRRTMGNRWERSVDDHRSAAVDLLVPAYTSRPRDTVHIGEIVTTEVPGLATALRRPPVQLDVNLRLTDMSARRTTLMLPDALSTLALKAHARTVRIETRDAQDLWRALEVCLHEHVQPSDLDEDESLRRVPEILRRELGAEGPALAVLTDGLQPEPATRMRTRMRALLMEVAGVDT